MLTKSDILVKVNEQWKENLDANFKMENRLNDLRTQCERSIKLSGENNSTIAMVHNLLKDVQDLCDQNKIDINNLIQSKVDSDSYLNDQKEINNRFRYTEFSIRTNQNALI